MDVNTLQIDEFTTIKLTEDQREALINIINWLEDESASQYKTLMGYAGTGKTTLLNELAQYAMQEGKSTIFTAPTNKAVKVLMDRVDYTPKKMSKASMYVDKTNSSAFSTIHSLLNIKPKKEGTKEIFDKVEWNKKDISLYDIVVVDECSMISEKLLDYIKEDIEAHPHIKVLFCGDPAQLQPINEEKSKCFDYRPEKLTSIVRHGDVIAKKSKMVRNSNQMVSPTELFSKPYIEPINLPTLVSEVQGFRQDPDKFRMLCYTNRQVKYWNHKLRIADYGRKLDKPFVEGDIIVANSPCEDPYDNERMLMANSEEGIVIKVTEVEKAWELIVEKFSGGQATLLKMKDEYVKNHKKYLNKLANEKPKPNWREYWRQKKMYHDVRHCYALTTHKSQGSTFTNIGMDINDINIKSYQEGGSVEERNQLVYVAMTRASEKVYIY